MAARGAVSSNPIPHPTPTAGPTAHHRAPRRPRAARRHHHPARRCCYRRHASIQFYSAVVASAPACLQCHLNDLPRHLHHCCLDRGRRKARTGCVQAAWQGCRHLMRNQQQREQQRRGWARGTGSTGAGHTGGGSQRAPPRPRASASLAAPGSDGQVQQAVAVGLACGGLAPNRPHQPPTRLG